MLSQSNADEGAHTINIVTSPLILGNYNLKNVYNHILKYMYI